MPDADWTILDLTKPDTTRLDSLHHPKTVQVCVRPVRSRTKPLTELSRMLRHHRITSNECSAKPRSRSMSKLDITLLLYQYLQGAVSRPAPPPNPWRGSSSSLRFKRQNVALDQIIEERLRPSRLPTALPLAQDKRVTEALNDYSFVASDGKRAEVSYGDLQRLKPGQWLNDEVINYFGSLIMKRSSSDPAACKETQEKTKIPAGANVQKSAASAASTSISTSMSTSRDVKGKGKALPTSNESEQPSSKRTGLDAYVYSSFFYSKLLESDCYQRGKIFKWTKDVSRCALYLKACADMRIGQYFRERHCSAAHQQGQHTLDNCGDQLPVQAFRVLR